MRSLDDVLEGTKDGEVEHEQVQHAAPVEVVEPAPAEDPKGDTPASPPADGAPPAPENDDDDKPLPAHVVKKIRTEKNDWKEKAIAAQAKLDERDRIEQQRQTQANAVHPQPEMSTEERFATQMFNERLNNSEILLRSKHEDVDEKIAVFMEAAKQNPALASGLAQQSHPYQWAYEWAQKEMARREIGDDPVAYRKRLEDEIRASMTAQPADAAQAARAPLPPTSLATARSAAPRDAGAWTGPPSLDQIIKRG